MKHISSHEDRPIPEIIETLYDIKGEVTTDNDEKIYSKKLNNKYFIRTFNNVPLDPFGPEARRQIWNRTELKSVSKSTFENYNTYLSTRNRLYLTKANRSYINA